MSNLQFIYSHSETQAIDVATKTRINTKTVTNTSNT